MSTPAAKMHALPATEHPQTGRVVRGPFARPSVSDPVLEDQMASASAVALDMTTDMVKNLARAGRVSAQMASQWKNRGKGSPLHGVTTIVYHATQMGEHPGAILAHLHATMNQAYFGLSDIELVRRFWSGMKREAVVEGEENAQTQTFAQHGDLDAVERGLLAEAAEQMELAAICRELRKRRIDPRSPQFN